jgi:hypothetical protein
MRQSDGPYTFWEMREAAALLYRKDPKEVLMHAKVSVDNRHKCRECFTCACVEVWRNKGEIGT